MTIEQFITTFLQTTPFAIIKILVIILLLLHLSFSFVLMRQTKLMTHVVEAQISPLLYSISIIHLLSSLFVFLWTMIFF
ncbi:hypothetical protein HY029_05845 [Candidatus Gottesmanbacteria bacterium]|nr:hypothetical protein [Candidatus Gottesmanbacteria bacterium]